MLRITIRSIVLLAILSTLGLGTPAVRADSSCFNVRGVASAQLTSPTTSVWEGIETSAGPTFHGVAEYFNFNQPEHGVTTLNGIHTYFTEAGDSFRTFDIFVAAPVAPPIFRVNGRQYVTGGTGIFDGATGLIHTHTWVDFSTGAAEVNSNGRVCIAE